MEEFDLILTQAGCWPSSTTTRPRSGFSRGPRGLSGAFGTHTDWCDRRAATIKALQAEVRELKRAKEILLAASSFFVSMPRRGRTWRFRSFLRCVPPNGGVLIRDVRPRLVHPVGAWVRGL